MNYIRSSTSLGLAAYLFLSPFAVSKAAESSTVKGYVAQKEDNSLVSKLFEAYETWKDPEEAIQLADHPNLFLQEFQTKYGSESIEKAIEIAPEYASDFVSNVLTSYEGTDRDEFKARLAKGFAASSADDIVKDIFTAAVMGEVQPYESQFEFLKKFLLSHGDTLQESSILALETLESLQSEDAKVFLLRYMKRSLEGDAGGVQYNAAAAALNGFSTTTINLINVSRPPG